MQYGSEVVLMVIEELGIAEVRPDAFGWMDACCPLHEENNPSFSINLNHGGWVCRSSCGTGGLESLVAGATGEPTRDVARRLRNRMPMDSSTIERLLGRTEGVEIDSAGEPLFYERNRVPKYMVDRGFDVDTLKRWQVGYDAESDSAVMPVRLDGKLVGLIRRLVDPGDGPKYLYTRGMAKDQVLFGEWMIGPDVRDVIVVEGPLDAMWLDQHGLPAVAILGSAMSDQQAAMLKKRFWGAVLAFDADYAGRRATKLVAEKLGRMRLSVAALPDGRKDVQECSEIELKTMFSSVSDVWYDRLRSRRRGRREVDRWARPAAS
jgi:DNA primase